MPPTRPPARLAALGYNRPLLLPLQHGRERDLDRLAITAHGRNPKRAGDLPALDQATSPVDADSPPLGQLAGRKGFELGLGAGHDLGHWSITICESQYSRKS